MKKIVFLFLLIGFVTGCKDKLDDPVGLDEVPKGIPKPVYVDGLVADTVSNFHFVTHTGSSQKLWIGKADYFETRILVRFSIDDSVVIENADSAKVTVSLVGTKAKTVQFDVFPLTKCWDEALVDWEKSSSDSQWNNPGGDYDTTKIATIVVNDEEETFTFNCEEFSLLDTSFVENKGIIFVYSLGDTNISFYSSENALNPLRLTVFYGDSTKDYTSSDNVSDAFIVNSTYTPGNNEILLGEGYTMRALFLFNIDTIPQSVTINEAFLTFSFKPENSFFDSMTVYVHRVTGEWNEDQTEYYSTEYANFTVGKDDTISEVSIKELVQHWVNEDDNYGILLKARYESTVCSRLILDVLDMPKLSIYYTPAPDVGN